MSNVCNKSPNAARNNCLEYFNDYDDQLTLCQRCYTDGFFNITSFQFNGPCYQLVDTSFNENDSVLYGRVKSWMQDLFFQFYNNNCQISASQDSNFYHPIQNDLYNICYKYDNLCSFAMGGNIEGSFSVCKNNLFLKDQYNKEDLSSNKNLAYFCGCFLKNENYIPTIPIECDSLCGATPSIKLFDAFNNEIKCQNNICSISDITINVYESTVGNINFEQICGGICGGISCNRCYLENITIDILQSKVGDINLVQKCGGVDATEETAFECYKIDNNGNYESVLCEEESTSTVSTNIIIFIIIISFIIILVILLIIFLIFKNKSIKVTKEDVIIQKSITVENNQSNIE
jgi:hypothetical protein